MRRITAKWAGDPSIRPRPWRDLSFRIPPDGRTGRRHGIALGSPHLHVSGIPERWKFVRELKIGEKKQQLRFPALQILTAGAVNVADYRLNQRNVCTLVDTTSPSE